MGIGRIARLLGIVTTLGVAAGCTGVTTGSGPAPATSGPVPRVSSPAGPAAVISPPLAGGSGPFMGSATRPDLAAAGYVETEYAASGTATSYRAAGGLPGDGRWRFVPAGSAAYRTRVLVRRPARAADFSGTVVVEWLNVSGGVDADPEWASLHEEITRRGDAWVGVSAQQIGVSGGPVAVKVAAAGADLAGKGLIAIDPRRYGSLQHPGDGFSFDIFTQIARALRGGDALGGVEPRRLIAAGESQSAFALVTYYNGVQPLTREFDGFYVHSRGAYPLPLVAPGTAADIAASFTGTPVIFRTDGTAPLLDIQTETDVGSVLDSYAVRQPDTDRFRLWEVAGTAHADAHLMGSTAASLGCGLPVNNGPMHLVAKAALRALDTWLRTGAPPPVAPRIEVAPGERPQIRRDADGIALGGIRTPPVDVPVATLSGAPGPDPSTICLLVGSTKPFSTARLAALYPSRADYQRRYAAAATTAIAAGHVLPQDRAALLGYAEPDRIPG